MTAREPSFSSSRTSTGRHADCHANLELVRRNEYRVLEMNRGQVVFDSNEQAGTPAGRMPEARMPEAI
jgi:hypothetical protein